MGRQTRDPLQRLPPEVAIDVIRDSLPSDRAYMQHLLDLTTISPKWQDFLLSTPILWNTLYLDETQPDFLALLATSIHYSADLSLKVVLWDHTIADWEGVARVLLRVHHRVTILAIRRSWKRSNADQDVHIDPLPAITTALHYLNWLPNLVEIELAERFDMDPANIEMYLPGIAQIARFTGKLKLNLWGLFTEGNDPFLLDRNSPVIPTKVPTQSIQTFRLGIWMRQQIAVLRVNSSGSLPHFNHFIASIGNSSRLESVVRSSSYNLNEITADVPTAQLAGLVNCLRLLPHLEVLDLRIHVGEYKPNPSPITGYSDLIVHRFRKLDITLKDSLELQMHLLQPLFDFFSRLYPKVKWVTIKSKIWPSLAFSYLEGLSDMEYLYLAAEDQTGDPPEDSQEHSLPSLEKLVIVKPPASCHISAPSLLNLVVDVDRLEAQLSEFTLIYVAKLTIFASESLDCRLLNPMHFLHVREITLRVNQVLQIRCLLSFLHLASIKVDGCEFYSNPEGNNLCVALIYYPEQCPSLQELHFGLCVDWDLLFLMLERRNFGREGVGRIHTVSLPFVPFIFRESFNLLLLGKSKERPPLMGASLDAAREVLWDPQIPGCFSCLTNMWPSCDSPVDGHIEDPQDPLKLFPDYEYHEGSGLEDIRDRINEHRYWLTDWIAAYDIFRRKHSRYGRCERYL